MANILFVDLVCPSPYSPRTLAQAPLGGSEASLIRIAERLAVNGHKVTVAQHNRTEAAQHGANYVSLDELPKRADAVVLFRTGKPVQYFSKKYPGAKIIVLLEDFGPKDLLEDFPAMIGTGTKILGVSDHHKNTINDTLRIGARNLAGITTGYVYNPIADDLAPDSTPVARKRLVFFSSPHKGLERTLEILGMLRNRDPEWELHVANPGYFTEERKMPEGVVNHGALPHHKVIELVRTACAVAHLNDVFPETFGIVSAEAAAVGVPVICHPLGATPEILGINAGTFVDVRDAKMTIERIELVSRQREDFVARLKPNPKFRMSAVIRRWEELING